MTTIIDLIATDPNIDPALRRILSSQQCLFDPDHKPLKYAHDDDGEEPPDRGWTLDQYGNRCRAP